MDLPATTIHLGRAAAGEAESLGWVVERFSPVLIAQARHRLGPAMRRAVDPEDVVHEVWAVTIPRLATLDAPEGRRTAVLLRFLSTAILHRVNNFVAKHLRGRRSSADDGGEAPLAELPDEVTQAVTRAVRAELHELVLREIDGLDELDRQVVVGRGIEQRANAEVAEELGLEPNTVAVRWRRALEKLRDRLPESVFHEID